MLMYNYFSPGFQLIFLMLIYCGPMLFNSQDGMVAPIFGKYPQELYLKWLTCGGKKQGVYLTYCSSHCTVSDLFLL